MRYNKYEPPGPMKKMHNLAGITIVNISRNILSYNILQSIATQEPAASRLTYNRNIQL